MPEDASSMLSCPIRILNIYLDRTKNSRPAKNTRLFLPLKKGISDIFAKTILLANESSGENVLTVTRLKLMKFVPLLLPGHFLIQPLFQRFCRLGFGDV